MSIGHFLDYRANARRSSAIALYTGQDMELSGVDGRSERLTGVAITSEYFAVLGTCAGARPRVHRRRPAARASRLAILSHRLWRDRFRSDPAIVGKTIRLDREPWTIIGVAPGGLPARRRRLPIAAAGRDRRHLAAARASKGRRRHDPRFALLQRRSPAFATASRRDQAREELMRLAAPYATALPRLRRVAGAHRAAARRGDRAIAPGGLAADRGRRPGAARGLRQHRRPVGRARRGAAQRAVAAPRARRQSLAAGPRRPRGEPARSASPARCSVCCSRGAGLPLLRQLLPADFPRAHEIALTAECGALRRGHRDGHRRSSPGCCPRSAATTLPSPQQRVTAGRDSRRLRTALVVGEIALAGVLCAGALFLLRSYEEIGARDHGFAAEGALTFRITAQSQRQAQAGRRGAASTRTSARSIARDPGRRRRSAPRPTCRGAATTRTPASAIVGRPQRRRGRMPARATRRRRPGYFEAAGMRLVERPAVRSHARRPRAAAHADRQRRAGQPLLPQGRRGRRDGQGRSAQPREIVGVVAGIKDYPADLDAKPAFWFPLGQVEFPRGLLRRAHRARSSRRR